MAQMCYEHKQVAYNAFCPQNIHLLLKYALRNVSFLFEAIGTREHTSNHLIARELPEPLLLPKGGGHLTLSPLIPGAPGAPGSPFDPKIPGTPRAPGAPVRTVSAEEPCGPKEAH